MRHEIVSDRYYIARIQNVDRTKFLGSLLPKYFFNLMILISTMELIVLVSQSIFSVKATLISI